MRSLWIRIGLGALGIFAVGMLAYTLVGEARQGVREALQGVFESPATDSSDLSTAPSASLAGGIAKLVASVARAGQSPAWRRHKALVDLPFVLDGHPVGTIRRVEVRRVHEGEVPGLTLLVVSNPGGPDLDLSGCDLRPADETRLDLEHGFSCVRGPETDLVAIGRVRFEPQGETRPLLVSRDAALEMAHGDPFQATADIGGEVNVTARGRDGAGVRIDAGDGHANIRVNDSLGRALVRLLADSTGAALRVRGKDGREIVRMDAGQGGFSLTVDTGASH